MAFWTKVAKARHVFLQRRQSVSNREFLRQLSVPKELVPAVLALRAALADRCCVDLSMLHVDDECTAVERIMGRGRWAWLGDLGYGCWDYLEFYDALERVLKDARVYFWLLDRHTMFPYFGSEGYDPRTPGRSCARTIGEWVLEAAPCLQGLLVDVGDEALAKLNAAAAEILDRDQQ